MVEELIQVVTTEPTLFVNTEQKNLYLIITAMTWLLEEETATKNFQ